jgi:hypothetical protein
LAFEENIIYWCTQDLAYLEELIKPFNVLVNQAKYSGNVHYGVITAINKMQVEVSAGLVNRAVLILVHFKFIDIDNGSCHIAQHPVKEVKRV